METNGQIDYQYKRQSSVQMNKTLRPVWFLFPGLGGQWPAMAKALMTIDIFANKIEECHQILKPYGIDLKHLLLSEDKTTMNTMTNKFVATTAIQIAMFDVLHILNIIPDGIIGHSFGEIACAYADGCLTTEEAILTTYFRGEVTESDLKIPKGLMAVVGMSWEETENLCSKGVHVVCNNSKDRVVVSGNIYICPHHVLPVHKKPIHSITNSRKIYPIFKLKNKLKPKKAYFIPGRIAGIEPKIVK